MAIGHVGTPRRQSVPNAQTIALLGGAQTWPTSKEPWGLCLRWRNLEYKVPSLATNTAECLLRGKQCTESVRSCRPLIVQFQSWNTIAQSLSLVGTTLSPSPTLLQFDVDSTSNWRRVPAASRLVVLCSFTWIQHRFKSKWKNPDRCWSEPRCHCIQFDRPIHTQFYRAWSPYDYCDCKCGRICRGSSRWAVDPKHVHRWCYGGHQQHLPESAASASGGALPLRTAKDKRLLPWQLEPS